MLRAQRRICFTAKSPSRPPRSLFYFANYQLQITNPSLCPLWLMPPWLSAGLKHQRQLLRFINQHVGRGVFQGVGR
jgi:hypothetical protein